MNSEKAVTPIRLSNSDVFLVLEWEKDKNLNLKILNVEEKTAYEGQATDIDLRSQAAKLRLSFPDFMLKTRDALFKNSSHQSNYLYSLDQTGENYVFKWKIIDSEETIISLGSLLMEKINFYSFLTQFLFSFADEMQSIKSCVENLNSELETYKSQLSTAMTNLSSAINMKKSMENELYSKFTLLLNEKKRKIKELENKQNFCLPITKKKKMPPTRVMESSEESDTEFDNVPTTSSLLNKKKCSTTNMVTSNKTNAKLDSFSLPKTKKKTMPPTRVMDSSDESDTEFDNVPTTSSNLNKKKCSPTNMVTTNETIVKLDSVSNISSPLKKNNNHFLNMLVSSSESDVDGELHIEDPGPSNKRLSNSLKFDDETKLIPPTQARKRKTVQKTTVPDLSSHSADKDIFSDDGSVDSLMELL